MTNTLATIDMNQAEEPASAHGDNAGQTSSPFPLPLTPFERYMIADDRHSHPMTFALECRLRGVANRALLAQAAHEMLCRHPLLHCRIMRRATHYQWIPADLPQPLIQWFQAKDLPASVGVKIDPITEPVMQLRAVQFDKGMLLQILVHHAAVDGIGIIQFLDDLLSAYNRSINQMPVDGILPNLDVDTLKQRGTFQVKTPTPVGRMSQLRFVARESWRFLTRRPCRIPAPSQGNAGEPMKPTQQVCALFPKQLSTSLTEFADQSHVSLNACMLAALYQTLYDLGELLPTIRQRRWLRIAVPINLRGMKDRKTPAANHLGYAFLDRDRGACGCARALMPGIHDEIRTILQWSIGGAFVQAVAALDRIPGMLYATTHLFSNLSTVVFSNLGDLSRRLRQTVDLSDPKRSDQCLELEILAGAPPVRPGTHACFATFLLHGQLAISMARDPQALSQDAAHYLMRCYLANLCKLAGVAQLESQVEVVDGLAQTFI
jgi:hypothetical protein